MFDALPNGAVCLKCLTGCAVNAGSAVRPGASARAAADAGAVVGGAREEQAEGPLARRVRHLPGSFQG